MAGRGPFRRAVSTGVGTVVDEFVETFRARIFLMICFGWNICL